MDVTISIIVVTILGAVFLVISGALLWQEAKRRNVEERVYVLRHAVEFVWEQLSDEAKSRLKRDDVKSILEWEIYYLQGLAQEKRSNPVEVVAGGIDASVEYIVDGIASKGGPTYSPHDVAEVLSGEAAYLASIGAIGEAVDPEELTEGDEAK